MRLKIPPPVVALLTAGLMWLLARATPMFDFALPGRGAMAICVAVAGVVVALMGVLSFRRAGTTVNPLQPEKASALVTGGIYRATRNPMYLGLLLALLGWAVFLSNWLSLMGLPAFVLYMNRFQIDREEAALRSIFGREFEEYQSRVRRWI